MVINLVILITFSLDDLLMLLGENWCWSLLGPKGKPLPPTYNATFLDLSCNVMYFTTCVGCNRSFKPYLNRPDLVIHAREQCKKSSCIALEIPLKILFHYPPVISFIIIKIISWSLGFSCTPLPLKWIIIQTSSLHNDQVISSYDIKHIWMAVIERPFMTKHSHPV